MCYSIRFPMNIRTDMPREEFEKHLEELYALIDIKGSLTNKYHLQDAYKYDLLSSYDLMRESDRKFQNGTIYNSDISTLRQIIKSGNSLFHIIQKNNSEEERKELRQIHNDIQITIYRLGELYTDKMNEMKKRNGIVPDKTKFAYDINFDITREEIVKYLDTIELIKPKTEEIFKVKQYDMPNKTLTLKMYDFLNSDIIPNGIKEDYCNTNDSISTMNVSYKLDNLYNNNEKVKQFFGDSIRDIGY